MKNATATPATLMPALVTNCLAFSESTLVVSASAILQPNALCCFFQVTCLEA